MRSSGSLALVAVFVLAAGAVAGAQGVADVYAQLLAKEGVLRRDLDVYAEEAPGAALLIRRIRSLVREYDDLARRNPRSGYSDNALFQAGLLSADAFWQFGMEADRKAALRMLEAVGARYPTSSLVKQVPSHLERLKAAAVRAAPPSAGPSRLKAIRHEVLPTAVRVTLELEREAPFYDERLDGPPRVFIDLRNTRPDDAIGEGTLALDTEVVRQVRVGRHQGETTRVVLDLLGATRHSVYALYNPYRVVIDFERSPATALGASATAGTAPAVTAPSSPSQTSVAATTSNAVPAGEGSPRASVSSTPAPPPVRETPEEAPSAPPPPAEPPANSKGRFSLSRQLGLGISRVVIDPGHGGHDPGARVKGLNEADLVLDVALRLEKLLQEQPGVEVVMTRRTNVYIPLEERTAIANRAEADLFLSIHANASRNPNARGIETYFLNFAPNPEAEAIAARENAGSARTMSSLPDIVKAIALNNKIDESRDFAALVQSSMFDHLRKANRQARNLGVKQAPFMVLIGATMPSVLAEISFLTNRQEASLLRTGAYRQQIADALLAGIMRYQKTLKNSQAVASQ